MSASAGPKAQGASASDDSSHPASMASKEIPNTDELDSGVGGPMTLSSEAVPSSDVTLGDPGSSAKVSQVLFGKVHEAFVERDRQMGARPKQIRGIMTSGSANKTGKKSLQFNVDPGATLSKTLRDRHSENSTVFVLVKDTATDTFIDAMHVPLHKKRSLFPGYFSHYEFVFSEAVISIAEGTNRDQTLSPSDCRRLLLAKMQELASKKENFEETRSTVSHPASYQTIGVQTTGDSNAFFTEESKRNIDALKKVEFVFDVRLNDAPSEGVHGSAHTDGSESDLQSSQETAIAGRASDTLVATTQNESLPPRRGERSPAGIMPVVRSQDGPREAERHQEEERPNGGRTGNARTNQEQQEIDTILEQLKEEMKCMICADHERDQIILPCSHFITCTSCTKKMKTCPFCRQFIQATITPIIV